GGRPPAWRRRRRRPAGAPAAARPSRRSPLPARSCRRDSIGCIDAAAAGADHVPGRPLVTKRVFVSLMLLAGAVSADEVHLKGGRTVEGIVVEQNARTVTLELGAGTVTLPMSLVDHIVGGPTVLATFR